MAAKKKRPVVITSTGEVYGKRDVVPFREDDDLLMGPPSKRRWSYACSKAIDEFLAMAYWEEYRVPVSIVRLFNTVGLRQTGRCGMVIPRFVQQALAGEPITVYGDGTQSRCFGYVGDVVRIDGIPHAELMKSVARRASDKHMLQLIQVASGENGNSRNWLPIGPRVAATAQSVQDSGTGCYVVSI